MGTVFDILSGHDLLHQRQKLLFIVVPTCLNGSLAGNAVKHMIPDFQLVFPAAGQQVCRHGLHSLGSGIRILIHGNLPQQHRIVAEFFHLEAKFLQKRLIGQQFSHRFGAEPHRNGRKQRLPGDRFLIGFQFFK